MLNKILDSKLVKRLFDWYVKKQIRRERARQILTLGYDWRHDNKEMEADNLHLWTQAEIYYMDQKYIKALALLQAYHDYVVRLKEIVNAEEKLRVQLREEHAAFYARPYEPGELVYRDFTEDVEAGKED